MVKRSQMNYAAVVMVTLLVGLGIGLSLNFSANSGVRNEEIIQAAPLGAVPLGSERAEAVSPPATSPRSLEEIENPFIKVFESVKPAVVQVKTERVVTIRHRDPFRDFERFFEGPFEDFFPEFFGRRRRRERQREEPRQERREGPLGSGFIIDEEGYILTSYHVIEGVEEIKVKLPGEGKEFKAEVIGIDPKTDVALIKIEAGRPLPVVKLGDSDKLRVGEWAIAIGSPFRLEHSMTVGVISGKGRAGFGITHYEDFIQTDASINFGNSGGPLVNIRGEAIGVNTFIISPYMAQGLGFAVPINMVKDILPQLRERGRVVRGWLGVSIQPVTKDLAEVLELPDTKGALVSDLIKGGPAEKAGIVEGDVIREFDGKPIDSVRELQREVARTEVGKKVKVKIIREGKEKTLNVTIGEMPTEEELQDRIDERLRGQLGLSVKNITEEVARRYDLTDREGVLVTEVKPGSPAHRNVRPGDIIKEVNRERIKNTDDFNKAMAEVKAGQKVLLHIRRGRFALYVVLTAEERE
ncbi:DegQ family serine endoprotease [candidate division NPL-UPA2 bacterium]|nr:DegQ family serine endoprotease [candidate division NPL-UPA2 bacterium]